MRYRVRFLFIHHRNRSVTTFCLQKNGDNLHFVAQFFKKDYNVNKFFFRDGNKYGKDISVAVNTPRSVLSLKMADEKVVYEQLIRPVEAQMMRTIWRIVRHDQLAEDTLQDAMTIIWQKRNRIQRHPNPPALILKICLNCAYDSLRKQHRLRQQQNLTKLTASVIQARNNASQELEQKQIVAEVLNAIGRLPRNQALAILMRIVKEQSYDVIAQSLGCSETTARIHVSRGRKRLSQWLVHLQASSSEESQND
jgi:RNA polymerase sigma-70 factor (ECF subfamily)